MSKLRKLRPKRVLLIEDDPFLSESMASTIRAKGLDCEQCASIAIAEKMLSKLPPDYLIADLAVPLGKSVLFNVTQTRGGFLSGLEFVRLARQRWSKVECLVVAGQCAPDALKWCQTNGVSFRAKPIESETIESFVGARRRRAFVVHGRNLADLDKLKTALAQIGIEPVVLFEQPSKGRTIIEKFEAVSAGCDFAVVALSGDDLAHLARDNRATDTLRARQNVIFELGYFYGRLNRTGGQTVLIDFGGIEIPSDVDGIVLINGNKTASRLARDLEAELGR